MHTTIHAARPRSPRAVRWAIPASAGLFAVFVVLGLAFCPHTTASDAKAAAIQGTITVAPNKNGTFSVQPQGTKAPADVVKVATDAKTVVSVALAVIKVADLKVGMWARVEVVNGIAAKIIAGHLWLEDGDKLVLFKGLPQEFFTHPAGFDVPTVPTKFGPLRMVYRLVGNGAYLRWGRKALPKEGMVVCWPTKLKAKFSYGGPPVKPDNQGLIHLPADVSELRIWFTDPAIPQDAGSKPRPNPKNESKAPESKLAENAPSNPNAIPVICVGDSITQRGYPAILQQLLGPGYAVTNAGHSGCTALRGTGRSYGHAGKREEKHGPKIVVFMLGTNDAKAPAWKERKGDFVKDYTALVESYKILSSHPKVYIALSPPIYRKETGEGFSPANLEEVVGLTKKVAQGTGADVIDVRAATSNHPDLFSDGVHPNEAGNAAIAKVVCEAITGKKSGGGDLPDSSRPSRS